MSDPERALDEKVREELKIGDATSTPFREAWVTGLATAIGAFIPVAPLLISTDPWALYTSFTLAMLSHFGGGRGAELLHRPWRVAERLRHVRGGARRGGGGVLRRRLDRQAALGARSRSSNIVGGLRIVESVEHR